MADSAIAVMPDLEAFVVGALKYEPGVSVQCVALITDWPQWQRRYTLQVDARARGGASKAWARAERARQLLAQLADDESWPDGVVTYVQPILGPTSLPDPDGCPRYTAHYEIRCHPRSYTPAQPAVPATP